MSEPNEKEVMELALEAGHLLLENGAEIFRVEETMDRICKFYGVSSGNAFVLSNGIFVTVGDEKEKYFAKVMHIPVSGINLTKVAEVNQLSRKITEGQYTLEEAKKELARIRQLPGKRPVMQVLASGIGSAAFCILFGGDLVDALATLITCLLLYIFVLAVSAPHLSKIVGNIAGGILLTALNCMLYTFGIGHHLNLMIIGSIMPLIPGVAFTSAIRDVADGDYISGSVRMLDALLVFFCIAIGVGFGLTMYARITGGGL